MSDTTQRQIQLTGNQFKAALAKIKAYIDTKLGDKQSTLVSGINIKTINNESIIGSGNITVAVDVPTKTSELTNDSGYITEADLGGEFTPISNEELNSLID